MPEMKSLTLNGNTYDCFVDSVARSLAVGSAVIDSASGENITISDASNYNLMGLRIFGKTTQDGTPTPNAPVDLVSVGDSGSITVSVTGKNDAQSMTISTPNGLPGIPVTDGGNYTDANGQQWVCDEIDFSRGVRVHRTICKTFTNASGWVGAFDNNVFKPYVAISGMKERSLVLCNMGRNIRGYTENGDCYCGVNFNIYLTEISTIEELDALLMATPIEVVVERTETTETPLTEEELSTYASLHTCRDNTTVSNDAFAHMEIEYVMDAKKYFDSLGGGGASTRLGSITLLSSKWTTVSDGLHSQIVSISGVTSLSKVDLLPSVEQLAIFHNKDVGFVTENEDGVVTVFAIGDKPLLDYTMDVQITEVTA